MVIHHRRLCLPVYKGQRCKLPRFVNRLIRLLLPQPATNNTKMAVKFTTSTTTPHNTMSTVNCSCVVTFRDHHCQHCRLFIRPFKEDRKYCQEARRRQEEAHLRQDLQRSSQPRVTISPCESARYRRTRDYRYFCGPDEQSCSLSSIPAEEWLRLEEAESRVKEDMSRWKEAESDWNPAR